jgi:protein-S-isoprenylcysteine O-methyltransferase Ste14
MKPYASSFAQRTTQTVCVVLKPPIDGAFSPIMTYRVQLIISVLSALLAMAVTVLRARTLVAQGWVALGSLTGWLNVGILLFYLIMMTLFIVRKRSLEASTRPLHWLFALAGTFLPFFVQFDLQPSLYLARIAAPFQLLGLILTLTAIATLGRGFGIIAARREIRTMGLYGLVRHPLYSSEAIYLLSIVVLNLSWFNLYIFALQIGCQIQRMHEEERLLAHDSSYTAYMKRVRFRLLPGVY